MYKNGLMEGIEHEFVLFANDTSGIIWYYFKLNGTNVSMTMWS